MGARKLKVKKFHVSGLWSGVADGTGATLEAVGVRLGGICRLSRPRQRVKWSGFTSAATGDGPADPAVRARYASGTTVIQQAEPNLALKGSMADCAVASLGKIAKVVEPLPDINETAAP